MGYYRGTNRRTGLWNPGAFAPEVTAYRLEHRYSIEEFAALVKCHPNTIVNWEAGRTMPRGDKWKTLKRLGFKRAFEAPEEE